MPSPDVWYEVFHPKSANMVESVETLEDLKAFFEENEWVEDWKNDEFAVGRWDNVNRRYERVEYAEVYGE